jgi:hypothetical protein
MMPTMEPRQVVAANRLIERLMRTVLDLAPGAARVRLTRLRDGAGWPAYDVTHSVAARGRWIGAIRRNQPLSDWRDFLPALLAGQCALHRIGELRSAAPAFGFPSARSSRVLVCPVTGGGGSLMGAIFIVWDGDAWDGNVWDGDAGPPERAALRRLMLAAKRLATQIEAVLDLCDALARPDADERIRQVA